MVGVGFEMMVMMMREVREDELKADFNDNEGDDEADVGFNINLKNEVDEGGGEDGKVVLGGVTGDKDAKGGGGVVGGFVGVNKLLDGFDNDVDTGGDDNKSDNNSGDAFNFCAVVGEFLMVC